MLTTIIAAVVGGILYRLRGGWFSNISRAVGWKWGGNQRTQTMRLIWSLPSAIFVHHLVEGPWWLIPALTVSFFASMALIGNGDYLDTKRKQPLFDLVGVIRNGIAMLPMAFILPYPALAYVATGALHAQIYALSHRFTNGQSHAAEVGVGALSWASIYIIFNLM